MRLDAKESSAGVHRHLPERSLGDAIRIERVDVKVAVHIRPGLEGRQGYELLWAGNRELSQHECIEQAAHCRRRANSERQRDADDQGVGRSPSQTAEGMPDVSA